MITLSNEPETVEVLEKALKYLFITRDKTVLNEQLSSLIKLKSTISQTKYQFIHQQNENNANKWYSIEEICLSIIEALKMFILLKENDPDAAWNHLIDAQNRAHWSNNAYQLSSFLQKECISRFHNIEVVLFPPQIFQSVSMVTVKSECSICNQDFSQCDHIRGEVYMGESCTETATEIGEVHHVAFVEHPDDKCCRLTHTGNKNPPTINWMTLLDESAT